ncbi:TAXI family TRAP transporter solute-binding subunit [Trinickia terrae]|uniref:TAXI family TRAP transporter solute-binding subunit n=1 Tax=Trinickia terrae TaxID=2571161 RepID=A0A4U1I3P9_9BURK|nr:TAXI family TRAP transporter solute-binding subunit [Trinickia terrae]TKC87835.1 TAXI family TRAP transporter solute-binding subunit [Trinickia terrae]
MNMNDPLTIIALGTATPGGGFPLYGDAAAAAVNETDLSLLVQTRNTAGSTENIRLLEAGELDMALVAGEPAYEAFAGIGRPASNLKIIAAIYSSPGMFAVRGDSSASSVRDLVGKPIAWGTRASGITLLGKYVMDGLGLDREKDFEPHFLEKAADGPTMLAEGEVAAQWGAGIGWPGFTTITSAGGRLIGLTPDEIEEVRAKHNFLKPIVVPAGSYPGQAEPIQAVGSWSYILGRVSLDDDVAYRFARALDIGHAKLVQHVEQGAETRPENTLAAAPGLERIHPGVLRYLADKGVAAVA